MPSARCSFCGIYLQELKFQQVMADVTPIMSRHHLHIPANLWLLVKAVEDAVGAPVVNAATGGAHGGGTSLTELGRGVVARYRAIESAAAKACASELQAWSKLFKGRVPDANEKAGVTARPSRKARTAGAKRKTGARKH